MNRLLVGGIGISLLGALLYVVGIATPAWMEAEEQQGLKKEEFGLWQICGTYRGVTICTAYPDTTMSTMSGALHATRAFAIIGSLMLIPGIALACFAAKKNINKGKLIGGALTIAGGVCGVIAAAIFAGRVNADLQPGVSVPYGYSFYLTWAQAVFTIGGGVAMIVAGRKDQE
ncbi:Hypp9093 [Branchiostoma lanceolatum]|uniref:Hypp9093 protein n=1 Tax=Branchiostoma lanceolatum TaxID=7740 RepID=A0A8J9ZDB0_BRALA|nr:Hypp9093 [Branchiostoma lanceolatum]